MNKSAIAIFVLGLSLSACGTTPGDRTASGAGLGAGAGAALGAITGGSVLGGALIGAAAGGLTGALTSPDQVNLGKPAWRQNAQAQPAPAASPSATNKMIRDIQVELARQGLYRGPIDGIAGRGTQASIRSYEQRYGLLVDGQASPALLNHMRKHGQDQGQVANTGN